MANNLQIGDSIYVQRSTLGLDVNDPFPFYKTIVRARNKRSIKVDVPGGGTSDWFGSRKVFPNLGVLIVRIGDYNEQGLIDPLYKSVLHFARILLLGELIRTIEVRTVQELGHFWNTEHKVCEQVILIGHGSSSGILFGNDEISADKLADLFDKPDPKPSRKEFISLCCQTGVAAFAKPFSKAKCCGTFIAPFHSVHGCIAAQFCQFYLTTRLLGGETIGIAFNQARQHLIGAASIRRWQNGSKIEN
jgi:hypothetical protein